MKCGHIQGSGQTGVLPMKCGHIQGTGQTGVLPMKCVKIKGTGQFGGLTNDTGENTRNWPNWCFGQGHVAETQGTGKLVIWPGPLEEMWL